jgi:hypothetical protein
VPHGGWCPKGRKAEDSEIAKCYQLTETPSSNYLQRTEWNVRDSDGTVVFSTFEVLTGGSKKTVEVARQYGKPVLHLSRNEGTLSAQEQLHRFIRDHHIQILNVAGPRTSKEAEVASFVKDVFDKV